MWVLQTTCFVDEKESLDGYLLCSQSSLSGNMECIIEMAILWTPEWKLNSVRWRLTRPMQLFISNNSCLGRLSFHIESFMKALEGKKSDITIEVVENLKKNKYKRNSRKLNNLQYLVGSGGSMRTFLNIISWV